MFKISILALRMKPHTVVDLVLYFFLWLIQRAFQIEDLYWKELFIIKVLSFSPSWFFLSYKEFNRIKSKHSCQIFWKFENWCHQFTIVQKMVTSRIILRNSLDDFDGGDSTNELHFWPQYTRVLFLIATFVIRLIHVCSAKSPLPQSKNWVLHVTRWRWWFMTELLKQK